MGDFARLLKVQFTSNKGMNNDAPIRECESEIGHYIRHYVFYSLRTVCGSFNAPQIFYYMCKGLWDGAYGLSSFSVKTRESNRLQVLLQRQHFQQPNSGIRIPLHGASYGGCDYALSTILLQ